MKTISIDELKIHLVLNKPIIDVRAPVEFSSGAIPNSINLPILDDEERALIGTCYRQHGQEKAIELGYQIVSGLNKQNKIEKWKHFIQQNPETIVTCFRGGQRSQITQKFLKEVCVEVIRIEKGYKQVRQFFIDYVQEYSEQKSFLILSGKTGSAKTHLINAVKTFYPAIDLEKLANHRGSAFGAYETPQPAQANLENNLAVEILKIQFGIRENLENRPILYEDESRLIGKLNLSEAFFKKLRESKLIYVEQTLEERIENIFRDYISSSAIGESFIDGGKSEDLFARALKIFEAYETALKRIEKRLGGLRMQEIMSDLKKSENNFFMAKKVMPNLALLPKDLLLSNKVWIEKLLVWYYDPLYESSLEKRNPNIEFKGNHQQIKEYLRFKK